MRIKALSPVYCSQEGAVTNGAAVRLRSHTGAFLGHDPGTAVLHAAADEAEAPPIPHCLDWEMLACPLDWNGYAAIHAGDVLGPEHACVFRIEKCDGSDGPVLMGSSQGP
jgi:hypothetical protein